MRSNYERRQREVNQFLQRLPREMYEHFKSVTPIRSGNARSRTDLANTDIEANYPYSVRLEKEGWSSQAPNGMSEPTIEFARSRLRDL